MKKRRCQANDLTALREALSYEPDTGRFVWIKMAPNRRVILGSEAGHRNVRGYVEIQAFGIREYAHRLAWLFMTGVMPTGEVDHRNWNKSDNRWENLRDVTSTVNHQNISHAQRNSTTGLLGVLVGGPGRFTARIRVNGENIHLGSFPSPELAHAAYLRAKRELHPGSLL